MQKYIGDSQLAERFGVSRATIWRWTHARNGFPSPIQLSPGTTRWMIEDVDKWEAERNEKRDEWHAERQLRQQAAQQERG